MLDPAEIKMFREKLLTLRSDLVALSEASQDGRKPVALDQQSVGRLSRMDALQSQAMQLETERRRQISLLRIDTALARMDDGEFGFCIACGDEMDLRRLEQDPSVTTCVQCARKGP